MRLAFDLFRELCALAAVTIMILGVMAWAEVPL